MLVRIRTVVPAMFLAMSVVGCHRDTSGQGGPPPAASLVTPSKTAAALYPTLAAAFAAADLRVEARRGLASTEDPLLARYRALLEAHFAEPLPPALAFQVVSVETGRHAVLLQATAGEARPLVFLVDSKDQLVWSKDHPIGGVKPGASEASLVAAPGGHVCLAWCNASSAGDGVSIALRRWAEDGGAFADYDALRVESCEALSALYWPRTGWVLAVADKTGATLGLVTENGSRGWGDDGVSLPWTSRTTAPVSLALDTPDTLMLFRLGRSGAEGSNEYVFASRFSSDGRPAWPGPLSVKKLPGKLVDPLVRVVLEPGDAVVRATLPGAATDRGENLVVDVASDGAVVRR